ncbi:DUF1365 domain-containing protein [Oleiphilus messinensis]|uniref:DUF1365 domain-containing protein n=1 Tax=Oleiphilus messinensis TaxID=141451 RepID=UPI001E4A93C4|nr:DUF1365 domain-containing protein [Oleiphilus messinensis]
MLRSRPKLTAVCSVAPRSDRGDALATDYLSSAVYSGWVRHRRFVPVSHEFEYPIFMLYLNLDELTSVFNQKWFCSLEHFNLVSFRRRDYLAGSVDLPQSPGAKTDPASDLKQAVIHRVTEAAQAQGLIPPDIHTVCLLTHVRYLNVIFNPVSFYYCFDVSGNLVAIVAEITNTPWGERHAYVLLVGQSSERMQYRLAGQAKHRFSFDKNFHVSPFNPMNMRYFWTFASPQDTVLVHMDNCMHEAVDGTVDQPVPAAYPLKHFDATLRLERKNFQQHFAKTLIRSPLMTVKVVSGIYWQALRLWLKRAPFYDHPN